MTNVINNNSSSDSYTAVPEFDRLNYFYGQMLQARDFKTEQSFFREKIKLHNRCLHGFGVVCGLQVTASPVLVEPCPPEPCPPGTSAAVRAPQMIVIECGMALDCSGNELIVRQPWTVDLWPLLSTDDCKKLESGSTTLYVSLCYCERLMERSRPVLPDACGGTAECQYGRIRDGVFLQVSTLKPLCDERCETCCCSEGDCCVLLAVIHECRKDVPLTQGQINNGVRRMLARYTPTVITGISWTHAGIYDVDEAKMVLGTRQKDHGLKIEFSRPILTETLTNGVIEVWAIEGSPGKGADIYSIDGELVRSHHPTTQELRWRQTSRESLQGNDRVLIILRCDFILDACCQPVDGNHVGGRVPLLPEPDGIKGERNGTIPDCSRSPRRGMPWTSGNGTPGGSFESWFTIRERPDSESSPMTESASRA